MLIYVLHCLTAPVLFWQMFNNRLQGQWEGVNALVCSTCLWCKFPLMASCKAGLCFTTGLQIPVFTVCFCETGCPHIGECPEGTMGVWVCVLFVYCWNLNIPNSTWLLVEVAEITVNE